MLPADSARLVRRLEPAAYVLYAGALTLLSATWFFGSMRAQLGLTAMASGPPDWSAPLDDVFIHFDFARSIARGYPFEWSEGNGFSSGGTSLLYPFTLALGYWLGFRALGLVLWAGVVAAVSTLGALLAARRLFRALPTWAAWLGPPWFLSVGALSWSLWSGMEVAFFLGLWGGAWVAWDDLVHGDPAVGPPRGGVLGALRLGWWGALLVATRPEAATTVAVLGLTAAAVVARRRAGRPLLGALGIAAAAGLPAVAVLVAQALTNLHFTGDTAAAGALTKLELHHPYLTAQQVREHWVFHLVYQLRRVTEYHFANGFAGYLVWALAGAALLFRSTRGTALLLLSSAVLWAGMVALNGQVRWQNERYAMPATAWVLLTAALGTAALLQRALRPGRAVGVLAGVGAVAAVAAFAVVQWPRHRDQAWFFGRASRNIRDQHLTVGRVLRTGLPAPPRRIAVSDAGAIPYAADLPAFDLIGLGGTAGLPVARASKLGAAAVIELIQRMPRHDRPDVLALYPSWWGTLPMWFGERLGEVPVSGNVICGGLSKVIYQADWSALADEPGPRELPQGWRLRDGLDLADLVSERAHGFALSERAVGFVEGKLLPRGAGGALPGPRGAGLWDAGRRLGHPLRFGFRAGGLTPGKLARVILRLAPAQPGRIDLTWDGAPAGSFRFDPADRFVEVSVDVPEARVGATAALELVGAEGSELVYQAWLAQPE